MVSAGFVHQVALTKTPCRTGSDGPSSYKETKRG